MKVSDGNDSLSYSSSNSCLDICVKKTETVELRKVQCGLMRSVVKRHIQLRAVRQKQLAGLISHC